MSYMWNEFNIKTFPAETLVFRDGVFYPDLSEYENVEYNPEKNLISLKKTPKIRCFLFLWRCIICIQKQKS